MGAGPLFLALIGFLHAEEAVIHATSRIARDNYPSIQQVVANDARFAVIFSHAFGIQGSTRK